VRTKDFAGMVAGFHDDAQLVFEGVTVGPFAGRAAIEAAYRDQPPDDEVVIVSAEEGEDGVVDARYSWAGEVPRVAGHMYLTPRHDLVVRLVITFDPQ
jgi:hypothetical protein